MEVRDLAADAPNLAGHELDALLDDLIEAGEDEKAEIVMAEQGRRYQLGTD